MVHLRRRHITQIIKKSLSFSPIVGIFGHRQVGKTTLAEILAEKYLTLDNSAVLERAIETPEAFLFSNSAYPLVIDECQLAPNLFPALKDKVRRDKKPGQYLLTGSVRFSSRKAIRESLTGRMIAWELLPMDFAERHGISLSASLPRLLQSKSIRVELKQRIEAVSNAFDSCLESGGLPGIFAIRNSAIRIQRFETQLGTILERDLRLLVQTSLSYRTLKTLFTLVAKTQGEPVRLAELSRKSRISIPTLRKLIDAFESMYLLRVIPTEGNEKRPVIWLEDQGEATFLNGGRYDLLTDLTRFLYSELRSQFHYRPELRCRQFQFRNRGGAFVPIAFTNGKGTLGIIPSIEETPNRSATQSAISFLKNYHNAKVLFVHMGTKDMTIDDRMRSIGYAKLL